MALLHRHRIAMALAMEWKDTPLLLLSLPLLNLPLLTVPLLIHPPPILEERVTLSPHLVVVPGRMTMIQSSRIMVVLRSSHASTHLEGPLVWSNPMINTIWNRHRTLETRNHPRQRQVSVVRVVSQSDNWQTKFT